jgi:hypothetical protein
MDISNEDFKQGSRKIVDGLSDSACKQSISLYIIPYGELFLHPESGPVEGSDGDVLSTNLWRRALRLVTYGMHEPDCHRDHGLDTVRQTSFRIADSRGRSEG